MPISTDLKQKISTALSQLQNGELKLGALGLLETLGYSSDKILELPSNDVDGFERFLRTNSLVELNDGRARTSEWKTIDFLFQLTGDEIGRNNGLFENSAVDVSDTQIESYLFFAIELTGADYSRTKLAEITREINKIFPMPAMIIFRYGNAITFSIIDRRVHKREQSKDVLGKVTLIKDIRLDDPHRAHIDILADLALENLKNPKNWVELQKEWQRVLDTKELNKKFFQELANWYFWAVRRVKFPDDEEKNHDVLKATSVIRLITRLVFVWFLKEKGLVSPELFDVKNLKDVLNFKDDSCYYKAILQNLFFATLNSDMGTRKFIAEANGGRNSQHFVHNVFRYKDEFKQPDKALKELFEPIPFLNGGLFECLDKEIELDGQKQTVRVDGFSQNKKNPLVVPDTLFFGEEREEDLNEAYGTTNKRYKVKGLVNILNSYKFTVAENTPVEEEIALDPELLGRVFENLLANYNPETKTTARKQTGSFYTPREIVNYMVDESLIAYLKRKLQTETEGFGFVAVGEEQTTMFGNEGRVQQKFEMPLGNNRWNGKEEELEAELRKLFSYTEDTNPFNETETEILIKAIDNCKILDPACGSGAFPMGILHRLVHLLGKLDPDNSKWKQWQKQKAIKETEKAFDIGDTKEREERLIEINKIFAENSDDYGRKLFLIENCIYGVDIQPIAIQIAKLRFFISLIVDQKAGGDASNNLGIRPLPNLETKFVAANTLIGLEAQGGLKPTKVNDLEKQLKEVRAKHFGARTRKTKEKYRTWDKEIRVEIAELLKQGGIKADVADQIAAWNPYDQNASAGWFDPEYMFGINEGLNVIIGNPPWVSLIGKHGIEANKRNINLYLKTYDGNTAMPNLYEYFILRSLSMLRDSGLLTFIVPDRLGNNSSMSYLRKKTLNEFRLQEIIYRWQFESVIADTMTLLIVKQKRADYLIKVKYSPQLGWLYINSKSYKSNSDYVFKSYRDSSVQQLVAKIRSLGKPLKSLCLSTSGFGGNSKLLTEERQNISQIEVIKGNCISRYAVNKKLYFEFRAENLSGRTKDRNKLGKQEKVLLRKTGNTIIAAYDNSGIFPEQSLYFLYDFLENVNPKYLLALLNSKLFTWYYLNELVTNIDSTPQLKNYDLDVMRVVMNGDFTKTLEVITNEIIEAKNEAANANTGSLEAKIDDLVYKIYGLTDEEIAIVEGRD